MERPKCFFIAAGRFAQEETKYDFFDMDFNHLLFTNGHPNATHPIAKPPSFEAMKEVARKLSANIPQVRVDLYDINGHIYFGEMPSSTGLASCRMILRNETGESAT